MKEAEWDACMDAIELLKRLGADRSSGVYLQQGCDEAALRQLQAFARRELGEDVPDGFLRLLAVTNGVQINGVYFKEAENLVAENLDLELPEVIVLGNDGNTAQYVFDKRDRRFHTINNGYPDERFASFDSFERMLIAVLKEQLHDEP